MERLLILIGCLLFFTNSLFAQCAHWHKIDTGLRGQINGVAMSPDGQHIVITGIITLHSTDRGLTWDTVNTAKPPTMIFGDNLHLFAVASSPDCNLQNGIAEMRRSTDYGRTWSATSVRPPMCFRDVFFLDSLYGWAVGSNKDSIVITKDGGRTLITRPYRLPGFDARGVIFLDSLRGWVGGGLQGTDTAVLATSDGGNTWTPYSSGIPFLGLSQIDFVDSLHGWARGANCIFHTSDGGKSWISQGTFCYFGGSIEAVQAVDSLDAWVFGDYFAPFIWKTTDGGQTWALEYNGPGSYIQDAVMINASHGVAVGGSGMVLIYSPVVTLGDLNGDGQITVTDIVLEINKVFRDESFSCLEAAADVNCDGSYSPSDVVLLLNRVYLQATFPCNL